MDNLRKSFLVRGNSIVGAVGDKNFSTAPIGTVLAYIGQTAPRGYLLADGASYPTTEYPDLYAVIGNTYGGDTVNFNVPDYRETVLVGVGENTTDAIADHDVYELGEFKDDQMESHTHGVVIPNHVGGSWQVSTTAKAYYSTQTITQTSTASGTGTTTHGKQKGVTYIIKAFHTNEGVDSGVSDDVVEYVEGEIAEVDTELTAKINAQTANRQVKTFDNTNSATEKWYKICSALTTGVGCNIKFTASRADSTATVQYFSALFRDNRYRYTSSYIARERTVYESMLIAEYSAYIIADANNDIWVHVPSYGKAIIEIDTRAITIDGTAGTPVKDYVYSSFEHQYDGKINDSSTNTVSTWSSSKIASEINPTIDISKVFSGGALNISTLCSTYGNGRYVIVGQGTAGNGSVTIDIWTLASNAISYIVNVTYSNKTSNTFIGLTYENPTVNFETNYLSACNHIAKVCTLV